MKTGLVWDERYMWYDFGSYAQLFGGARCIQPGTVVESPESKRRIMNLLAVSGMLDKFQLLAPQPVTEAQLTLFHSAEYVEKIKHLSATSGGDAGPMAPLPRHGYDIAALAAGGTKAAIDAVLTGTVRNAYALVRPPGHHAEKDHGMGLCVFGNAVVAVKAAMAEFGLGRVAIVDWDAHHGNGTESAFYDDPTVLTVSIHQDQMIPGRGYVEHRGVDRGEGYNINIPLPPGSGTGAYLAAFERVVLPAIRSFGPDLILVASGLDAAATDPTARMLLNAESYRGLTRQLMQIADEVCGGRLALTHEGGYDATQAPFCALAIFEQLSGISSNLKDENPFVSTVVEGIDYQALQPHQEVYIQRAEALLARR